MWSDENTSFLHDIFRNKVLLDAIIQNQMQWTILNPYLCMKQVVSFLLVKGSWGTWISWCQFQKCKCFQVIFYQGFVRKVEGWQFFQKCLLILTFIRIMPWWIVVITPFPSRGFFATFPFVFLRVLFSMIWIWRGQLRRVSWLVGVSWWLLVGCSTYWLGRETLFPFCLYSILLA